MNILIIYFSKTQNTKSISLQIKDFLEENNNIKLIQIKEKKKLKFFKLVFTIKSDNLYSMVFGLPRTVIKTVFWKKSKIKNNEFDFEKYDLLIIGTPIWYGRLPPPINTLLSKIKKMNIEKKAFIFINSGYGKNFENYIDIFKEKVTESGLKVIGKLHINPENPSYLSKENKYIIKKNINSIY